MRVLTIKTSGVVTLYDIESGEDAVYHFLKTVTGGYIEAIALPKLDGSMYLNEDGKGLELPFNDYATRLVLRCKSGIAHDDHIVGDVVVVGQCDIYGNDKGLTDDQLKQLSKAFEAFGHSWRYPL